MSKKFIITVFCIVALCAVVSAQQITKFGVVDTSRVYESFFRDTGPVRKNRSCFCFGEVSGVPPDPDW